MAKVRVVPFERSLPLTSGAQSVESRAYLAGSRDPLHLIRHALAPNATFPVHAELTDVLVYVHEGELAVGDVVLIEGASMVVELGARSDLVAGACGSVVLTFARSDRAADARAGGHVHLLPRHLVPCTVDLGTQNEMGGGLHADASCPTCTVWLHENDFHRKTGTIVPPHSHSENEIIFVTAGGIKLGNRIYGRGTALAIAADTIYGFEAAPGGLSFINFRVASPTVTTSRGVMDEAQSWVSKLGRPPWITMAA
jgi:hypothetical protein